MPRLILTLGSGARTADVRASALSNPQVQDAVEATQADAVIVSVSDVTSSTRAELSSMPGVTGVHDDIQGIPLVAEGEEVEDFLRRVRDLRGEDAPPTIETRAVRAGEPVPDGGAVVLPVPAAEDAPVPSESGPMQNVDDALNSIGIQSLHEQGILGQDVVSVIVDTGSCPSAIHSDRQLDGTDLTGQEDPWSLFMDHGGMATGIMAGDDSTPGIDVGVLPESDVYPIKTSLAGSELIQAQDVITQLADQTDKTVVVNNSWGFPECTGICSHPVTTAIENASNHPNVIQVFAAGNEAAGVTGCGQQCDGSTPGISGPNSLSNVITVAAAGKDGYPDEMQNYSSRGGPNEVSCGNRKPDVTAPIFGRCPYGCTARNMGNGGGTSATGPQVAGVVGLLAMVQNNPTTESIRQALTSSAVDVDPGNFDGCSGAGLARADAAAEITPTQGPIRSGIGGNPASLAAVGVSAGIIGAALRERYT